MAVTKKKKKKSRTQKGAEKTERSYGAGVHKTTLNYNDPMFLLEVEGLARDGFDDQQIAEIFDVAPKTFYFNKNKRVPVTPDNPTGESALSITLKRGRRPLSVLVENALYKRATGLKVKSTVTRMMVLPDGTKTDIEIVQTTETELPPDTGAAMAWLKHHKPDIYNQQPVKVDVTSGGKEISNNMPRITHIEHVTITDKDITKQEVDI